jgi:hypothetical protein
MDPMGSSSGGRLTAVSTAASRCGAYCGILQRRLSGGGAQRPPALNFCFLPGRESDSQLCRRVHMSARDSPEHRPLHDRAVPRVFAELSG